MKIFLFSFLLVLTLEPVFAQRLVNSSPGSTEGLSSLATRQYLSGREEESLVLYQKAIAKSESEYGKNSRIVGTLNYELGVRALALSKFNLAEHCFKKAVDCNPNCEAAQLMLIQLLRFRNKDEEAYYHTQQALKKHADSMALRRDAVISLQGRNPASATQQAYMISCLQNGTIDKASVFQSKPAEQLINKNLDKDKASPNPDPKPKAPANNDLQDKTKHDKTKVNESPSKKIIDKSTAKAVYQPINKSITQPAKSHPNKSIKKSTRSRQSNSSPKFGLVPPPPPLAALGFPTPPPKHGAQSTLTELKAKAESIKNQPQQSKHNKTEAHAAEEVKKAPEHTGADDDPDFLIEWASVKKKHGK